MSKPRYRKNIVQTTENPQLRGTATENHDAISEKEIYVTHPSDDGIVNITTSQQDYYPWDAGAHIITEEIEDFKINLEFDYLTTDADKTHRDLSGNIISQNNSSDIGQDLVIVPQRHVLEKHQYVDIVDVDITELIQKIEYGPTGPPILRENPNSLKTTGILIFPTHGTSDGQITDGDSIFEDPMLATIVYQFPGNHSRVLIADAYSYLGEDDVEIEDELTYEWVYNSDAPAQYGLATRKKISNKIVSTEKKLSLINGTIFYTGFYYCRIKNSKGTTNTSELYILCKGGLIIEREALTDPEGTFIGYGQPTGELLEDQKHNMQFHKTAGWMDFDTTENQWIRTSWDRNSEEWYRRDAYNDYDPWRTPKYGPEPQSNDDVKEQLASPTKSNYVSKDAIAKRAQPVRQEIGISQVQKVARNVIKNNVLGRSRRIINPGL